MAGLFVPEQEVEKLLSEIENDIINSLEKVELAFRNLYESR